MSDITSGFRGNIDATQSAAPALLRTDPRTWQAVSFAIVARQARKPGISSSDTPFCP